LQSQPNRLFAIATELDLFTTCFEIQGFWCGVQEMGGHVFYRRQRRKSRFRIENFSVFSCSFFGQSVCDHRLSRSANPAAQECSRAGPGCSLSPGERAGVRGDGLPNKTISQKQISAPPQRLRRILTARAPTGKTAVCRRQDWSLCSARRRRLIPEKRWSRPVQQGSWWIAMYILCTRTRHNSPATSKSNWVRKGLRSIAAAGTTD